MDSFIGTSSEVKSICHIMPVWSTMMVVLPLSRMALSFSQHVKMYMVHVGGIIHTTQYNSNSKRGG